MEFFKGLKKTLVGLLAGVTLFATTAAGLGNLTTVSAASLPANSDSSLNLDAKAAIAVDATTGQVMYSKNAQEALPVASMSKLLTTYLVLKAIHSGKLSWNDKITPDEASQKVSQNTTLSNVPLKADHSYTVKSLYEAMLIYSANGATMALAYKVGGSHQNFINMINVFLEHGTLNINNRREWVVVSLNQNLKHVNVLCINLVVFINFLGNCWNLVREWSLQELDFL